MRSVLLQSQLLCRTCIIPLLFEIDQTIPFVLTFQENVLNELKSLGRSIIQHPGKCQLFWATWPPSIKHGTFQNSRTRQYLIQRPLSVSFRGLVLSLNQYLSPTFEELISDCQLHIRLQMAWQSLIGKQAPSLTLTNYNGDPYTLTPGKNGVPIALFFYPKSGSYGCTKEACQFRDALAGKQIIPTGSGGLLLISFLVRQKKRFSKTTEPKLLALVPILLPNKSSLSRSKS